MRTSKVLLIQPFESVFTILLPMWLYITIYKQAWLKIIRHFWNEIAFVPQVERKSIKRRLWSKSLEHGGVGRELENRKVHSLTMTRFYVRRMDRFGGDV